MKASWALLAAALSVAAGPAWGCVVVSNTEYIEIDIGGGPFRVTLDSLESPSYTQRSAELMDRLTAFVQVRWNRSTLPLDEPTKAVDPGPTLGERMFWCDADGTPTPGDDVRATHVCSPSCIIDEAWFDFADQIFVLIVRQPQDCNGNPDFPSCL